MRSVDSTRANAGRKTHAHAHVATENARGSQGTDETRESGETRASGDTYAGTTSTPTSTPPSIPASTPTSRSTSTSTSTSTSAPKGSAQSATTGGALGVRTRASAPRSLREYLAELVVPRGDLAVLELGPRSAAAEFARARGQVTAFVDDGADDAVALDALSSYHHVEERGGALLSTLGVHPGRFDLVVARAHDVVGAGDAACLIDALAPGGTLVVHTSAKRLPPALLEAAVSAGLVLSEKAVRIDGGRAFALTKPGARAPLPVDRTACVDRARVASLLAAPLVEGPARLAVVDDNDAALRAQLDALRAALVDGVASGVLDPATVPFPDRVAASALRGEAGVDCLVVFAHPDDESGYAAGALARIASEGKTAHYAVATDGGGGLDASGGGDDAALGVRRRHELDDAARALGIGGITVLGLADAGMYEDDHRAVPVTAASALSLWGVDAALEKMVRAIREQRPQAILGFDPTRDPDYGLHGHHLAMGLVTAAAVHLAADPRAFPEQGLAPWSVAEQWAVIPPGSFGGRQVTVDVDSEKKKSALQSYKTQARSLDGKLADAGRTEHWHLFTAREGPRLLS